MRMKKFFYRVEENDTVMSVASKFSLPLFLLIEQNNLTSEVARGDLLYIENSYGQDLYEIKPTDTLESVASKFNVDKTELLMKNKTPYLFVGLKIII